MNNYARFISLLRHIGRWVHLAWQWLAPKAIHLVRTLLEAWQNRAARDPGDPLHFPRLVVYFLQRGISWVYLLASIGSVIVAGYFAFNNPLERTVYWGRIEPIQVPGSPVICVSFLLIALFLFGHFRSLRRTERPVED